LKRARRGVWVARFVCFTLGFPLATLAWAGAPLLVSLPLAIEAEQSESLSGDLVALLATQSGQTFAVARHDNALAYLRDLDAGRFAVVLEGPHVLAALARRGDMIPTAEFRRALSFVLVVPRVDNEIYQLGDLAGKPLCSGEIPDLFALQIAEAIDNPAREPTLVPMLDHRRRIRQLLGGQCRAASLQTTQLLALEPRDGADDLRIIYKSRDLPGFGIALSAALAPELRERITETLLSGPGRRATRALAVALFGDEAPLGSSDPQRLLPLAGLMDDYLAH
jgi:hypothetical protein